MSGKRFLMLERIKDHLAQQNWTAVALEFVIVVTGVAIGFQITEWNRGRLAEEEYQIARDRLIDETRENISQFENYREFFDRKGDALGRAIEVLESCETGDDALSTVVSGLEYLRQTNAPLANLAAAERLIEEPSLISRQSKDEQLRLQKYHERLVTWNYFVRGIEDFNDLVVIDNHPFVGFSDFYTTAAAPGFEQRRPELAAPLTRVCKDNSFKKLFYVAERRVNYLETYSDARVTQFRENLDAMDATQVIVAE